MNEMIRFDNTTPSFLELIHKTVMTRMLNGAEKLKTLMDANVSKRTDNTALFDAINFRDQELIPLKKAWESCQEQATSYLKIELARVRGNFKSRKGETMREPEALENHINTLNAEIIKYQKRELPDEKTIRTGAAQVTIRTDRVLEINDKLAFIKACVSTAKGNEAFDIDLIDINIPKLKEVLKTGVKEPKSVKWVYKQTAI